MLNPTKTCPLCGGIMTKEATVINEPCVTSQAEVVRQSRPCTAYLCNGCEHCEEIVSTTVRWFGLPINGLDNFEAQVSPETWNGFPVPLVPFDFAKQIAEAVGDPIPDDYTGIRPYDGLCWELIDVDGFDDVANYPVPEGLRRRVGVEYGCGKADCADCYELRISPPDADEVARFEAEGGASCV